ncbi:MAG TPA: hypothetical protein VGN77_01045 [Steroidobacteraceae bacterium]|nr:hypothetical protein [Steroidobacteraceae bacterium]
MQEPPDCSVPLVAEDIATFVREFEACTLPKPRWTHQAHLLVGLWYLSKHTPAEALNIVRQRIRAYNVAVGTANTDHSGYHETLTHLYLDGIAAHLARHSGESLPDTLRLLLNTPLARSDWPLEFYSRKRLFSVLARRQWVAPDLPGEAPFHAKEGSFVSP